MNHDCKHCNWSSYIQIHPVKKHVLMMKMMGYDGVQYVDLLGMDPEGWVYLGFTWGL